MKERMSMKKGGVAVLATIIGAAAGAAGSEYFAQKQVKEKSRNPLRFLPIGVIVSYCLFII